MPYNNTVIYNEHRCRQEFIMDNRRQCTRHELIINFPVINSRTAKRCGYLLDITPEGFQLVSEQPFVVGDVLHAKIEGDFGDGYEQGVALDGICKWCRPDVNKRFSRAGFEISDEFGREPEPIIRFIADNRL